MSVGSRTASPKLKRMRVPLKTVARPQHVIRKAGARRSLHAEQGVVLQAAAKRVKKARLEVPVHGSQIVVVCPLGGIVSYKNARFQARARPRSESR